MLPSDWPAEWPYFEVHDGTGPTMLFLHGFLSSRAQWKPNLAGLKNFVRSVLVELLGHGRSPSPARDEAYDIRNYLAAFDSIRQRLGQDRWFVCGQSFGAGPVTHYALAYPQHTYGLIITNTLAALSPAGDPSREEMQRERIKAVTEQGRAAIEALRIYPAHAKRLPEDAKAEMVADAAKIQPDSVLRSWRVTSPQLMLGDRIDELKVPVLLVNGLWEKRFQPLAAAARKRLPSMKVVELEGGHSINMEAPDGFNKAVEEFVKSLT
jgi:2-succinyl-6-hydroxy-2,4-cyclohexadiene-1-carboxylate synthase